MTRTGTARTGVRRRRAAAAGLACALAACDAAPPESAPHELAPDEVPPAGVARTAEDEDRLMGRYLEGLQRATEIVRRVRVPGAEATAAAELQQVIYELRDVLDELGPLTEDFRTRNLERYYGTAVLFYQERRRVEEDPELGELLEPLFAEMPTPE